MKKLPNMPEITLLLQQKLLDDQWLVLNKSSYGIGSNEIIEVFQLMKKSSFTLYIQKFIEKNFSKEFSTTWKILTFTIRPQKTLEFDIEIKYYSNKDAHLAFSIALVLSKLDITASFYLDMSNASCPH